MSKTFPATHPYAIERPSLIPAPRYYDAEFYALENERLWPRVWQMACRLEEIPKPGDFVVYDILDQSVIVTRVDDRDGEGLSQRLPPSRRAARQGPRPLSRCLHLSLPRLAIRDSTANAKRSIPRTSSSASCCVPTICACANAGSRFGEAAPSSISTTRLRRCAHRSSRLRPCTTPGTSNPCARSGGSRRVCR